MGTILVTGATGTLGRPTVARLRAAGHDVRALSRKCGPGLVTGDLLTGEGIREAVTGAEVVLHLATGRGRNDITLTKTLLDAARDAGTAHLVLVSIVGIEQIPLGYYQDKVEIERLVRESSLPHTMLRATQFHDLVDEVFTAQRYLPVVLAPSVVLQPIAADEVAGRLVEIAEAEPAGRLPDIGGPQQRALPELARAWRRAKRSRRPIVTVRLPGRTFAAFAAGHPLVPGPAYGVRSFEDFLADRYVVTV
ncbi:MAG TPA: NAD(P)H-binding protein [Kribbella sp.]|nr:NAD(P)H-binding protein [Kribbella sp.]